MKKENTIDTGLSLGTNDIMLVKWRKKMEADYGSYATVKMILEDNNVVIDFPKGFNLSVSNPQALGSWSETFKRKLITAYTDTIISQSGLKPSELVDELKILEIVNKQEELKQLIKAVWESRYARFHQDEALHQEFIRTQLIAYVYHPKVKALANKVWETIRLMRSFDAEPNTIRQVFSKFGLGHDLHTLTVNSLEKAVGIKADDELKASNVKGSVCKGFKMPVETAKVVNKVPSIDRTPEDFIRSGNAHKLIPSVRKEAEKKMARIF